MKSCALLWDFGAIPWAPIMLGLLEGLESIGVDVVPINITGGAVSLELARRACLSSEAVLVGVHHQIRPFLPTFAQIMGRPGALRPWVALSFDDPYDMLTTLDLAEFFDVVLTPEPCAVDVYRRKGKRCDVLAPTVSDSWHWPANPSTKIEQTVDVMHIGGNQWAPRRAFFAQLVPALRKAGKSFAECAGNRRWIVGPELTAALHACKLTLDLPRAEFFASTNPHGIPCTYTGPRVHLAAACGVPILCIEPRGDLEHVYPNALHCRLEDGIATVLELVEDPMDVPRRVVAARSALDHFHARHAPRSRARELVTLLDRL